MPKLSENEIEEAIQLAVTLWLDQATQDSYVGVASLMLMVDDMDPEQYRYFYREARRREREIRDALRFEDEKPTVAPNYVRLYTFDGVIQMTARPLPWWKRLFRRSR